MKKVSKLSNYQIKKIKVKPAKKSFLAQMIGFRPRIAVFALIGIAIIIAIFYTFRSEAATAWPLRISSNGHYLEDQNGKAYLYTADTSWYMIAHLSVADAKRVIDTRKSQGFTAIQTLIPGWSMKEKIGPRGQLFINHNITTPNEEFFKGMDEIVAYAKSKDMVLFLGAMDVKDLKTYSDADIKTYGTWLVNRYKGYGNILWYVGSDDGPDDGIDKMRVLAQAMKAADPNALISSHFWGLAKPFFLGNESWYGFYGYQWNGNGKPWCYEIANEGYNTNPTKPFLNLEPAYEPDAADGTKTTDLQVRTCAWGTLLGGGMGIAYGGPRDSWAIGQPNLNWSALDRPSAVQAGIVNKIMSQFAWEKLVPDMNGTVVKGDRGSKGTNDYVTAGATADGSLVVAYTPKARSLTIDMSKLSGPANAFWFDPANATKTDAGINLPNSGSKSFTTPGNNAAGESDFVLIITTGQQSSPAPSSSASTAPSAPLTAAPTEVIPTYECIGGTNCVPSATPTVSAEPDPTMYVPEEDLSPTNSLNPTQQPDENNNGNPNPRGFIGMFLAFLYAILQFLLSLFR